MPIRGSFGFRAVPHAEPLSGDVAEDDIGPFGGPVEHLLCLTDPYGRPMTAAHDRFASRSWAAH